MSTLHMLHALEVGVGQIGSTVRKGFKWAAVDRGEFEEPVQLVLCVCRDHCADSELCGESTYLNVMDNDLYRQTAGHWAAGNLWSCDNCEATGLGQVLDVWVGRFEDIPARLLAYEHEQRSREYAGLLQSMRKAYGDTFTTAEFVTVLTYERVA